jgi:inward rectifier potassium channel
MKQKNIFNKTVRIESYNGPDAKRTDLYYSFLKTSWWNLLFYYVGFFILVNLFFATLYYLDLHSLSKEPHSFSNCFFFSVQTFSTVGYGSISPNNLYSNIIVVLEIMIGVISTAVITGLVFSKFSIPRARLLFTKNLLQTKFNNNDVLMFRVANTRANQLVSAKVELHYLYEYISPEGLGLIRFAPLKLQRNYSPVFSLSWTVIHDLDESSPLYKKSLEDLIRLKVEFFVIINGTDGTFSQNIHDTHRYTLHDILKDQYFVDIVHMKDDGTRVIDFANFHVTRA